MQDKKRYEIRKGILIFISIFILISAINIASAARLPTVGGDSGGWGTLLNEFFDIVSSSQIVNGTITDTDISDTTNLTLGEKITFTFGEIIDNIVNGWIKITGGLNVTQNLTVGSSALFVDSSSGNVGIGTTDPERKLDVDGIIRAKNNYVGADTGFRVAGTSVIDSLRNLLNINNATISYNLIVDTNTFVVNSTTHKVGIGTATPQNLLNVLGNANITGTLYAHNISGNSPIIFLNGSGAEAMRVTESGNLNLSKGIILGNYGTKPTCDATHLGMMVFDTTNGRPYVCDGTNWNPMDSKLPKTGQTTCHNADGDLISCSGTGQDGEYQMGAAKSYTDNEDGTTTDDNTGLMWCDDGNSACAYNGNWRSWSPALTFCNDLTFATHNDWRLPNVYELYSIVLMEPTQEAPYVDTAYFSNIATDRWYLTSTTRSDATNYGLFVYFSQGWPGGSATKYVEGDVLCVRGGSS